ncbi:hypothetical protein [Terrarubrum flagellatum]|uniref:hypothetical protein n=1 Tax=Terrirubrum flagellatum TaxID=2895980 RepID=UPI0031455500
MLRPFLAASACALLAACNTAAPPPPPPGSAPNGVTPSTFSMPSGGGCAGEVARFQAVIDNDLETGHTIKRVHEAMSAEIAHARTTCQSGNDGGAIAQLNATKAKFGYRQG